jgi:hypothetical protein
MLQPRLHLIILLVAALVCAGRARAGEEGETPEPHDTALVKQSLERFEQDYEGDDLDKRIRILKWFGQHRHDIVLKELKKIWLREADLELRAAAAEGLGHQLHAPRDALKLLMQGLDKYEKLATGEPETDEDERRLVFEERVLVNAIESIGRLGRRPDWKDFKGFIDHNSDGVAIAAIRLCAQLQEYRALPVIYQWFEHYPDGVSWDGGSVRVDTGAAGSADANAAKAKWRAKYGSRAKRARPNTFAAMVECVHVLTGQEITKREQLKDWMDENRDFLKRQGV